MNTKSLWRSPLRALAIAGSLGGILALGCDRGTREGVAVDYGPETNAQAITSSVGNMVRDTDPTQVKVGAFGRFLTNDNIGGGTLTITVANTSQEVTSRTIANNILTLQLLEKTTEYHGNSGTPQKMTRSFQLNWKLPSADAPTDVTPPAATSSLSTRDFDSALHLYAAQLVTAQPITTMATTAPASGVSYHRLSAWEDMAPAPEKVAAQPNCLGLPKCQIRLRHVNFDIVTWDEPKGNRIHLELTVSPDVPQTIGFNMNPIWEYIPGLVRSCITRLVGVGTDGRNKTLISECKDVINFAFDSSQLTDSESEAPL